MCLQKPHYDSIAHCAYLLKLSLKWNTDFMDLIFDKKHLFSDCDYLRASDIQMGKYKIINHLQKDFKKYACTYPNATPTWIDQRFILAQIHHTCFDLFVLENESKEIMESERNGIKFDFTSYFEWFETYLSELYIVNSEK